jgi:hypothetical protein
MIMDLEVGLPGISYTSSETGGGWVRDHDVVRGQYVPLGSAGTSKRPEYWQKDSLKDESHWAEVTEQSVIENCNGKGKGKAFPVIK